ncbi:MAG: TonB-dependent receptor [Candidatus Marinimicrobia bacterium]|nr:TonB-dependent receptor [Candidatus Neomarinimicrobiota bacterium]
MRSKLIFYHIFLLITLSAFAIAGTTGKIMGRITDQETGEAIIGADVYLPDIGQGSMTDLKGDYFIIGVRPGTYTLVCSYIGYQKTSITDVFVNVDLTTNINIEIIPETLEGEEVIVVSKRVVVEKSRTNTTAYVSAEKIASMPVQEVSDLIQLQAGVVQDAGGGFHIRGGRGGEIAYLIDGVPVTDQYNGGSSIGLENSWVQELQVISGTFNAEYGQAQSGIINVVTKEGARKFSGNISVTTGDHVSASDKIFWNLNTVGLNEKNISSSFQGPLFFLPDGSFYSSVRYRETDGWLYGRNNVRIEDTVPIQDYINEAQKTQTQDERSYGIAVPDSLQTGDGTFVPIDGRSKVSVYTKITTKVLPSLKLRYSLFYTTGTGRSYSDYRRFSPDGVRTWYDDSYNHIFSVNHVLSNSTFYTINFSKYSKNTQAYLFEDPLDQRYRSSPFADQSFSFGGTQNGRYDITRSALSVKGDFISQINHTVQIQFGGEIKRHHLDYYSLTTVAEGSLYEEPILRLPDQNTSGFNHYEVKPIEGAGYFQSVIESEDIIVNMGLRFDYWDPSALIPVNLRAETDTDNGIRLDSELEPGMTRQQLSPRFGLAYPISDRGVIHVSYGHFFQLPRFNAIYNNYEYEIKLGGLQTKMGNVNLKPEKTIGYEIGLQQQLTDVYGLELTMYYKDISNLLSQEIISTIDKKVYARYINRDYGNVRGVTFTLNKLYSNFFSASVDYTYQLAKGNASDPNAIFNAYNANKETEKQVLPLDWDQTHTLNASFSMKTPSGINMGIIGRFATGQPYTPSSPGSALDTQFENSDRKPTTHNFDLNIHKTLKLSAFKVKLFCKVFNLTDQLNQRYVYSSTGNSEAPYRTIPATEVLTHNPNFTIAEVDLRPDFYSEPRRVLVGIQVKF